MLFVSLTNCDFGLNPRSNDIVCADTGPEDYKDAPVAIQLVGYKQADEALLKLAISVDSIVNNDKD